MTADQLNKLNALLDAIVPANAFYTEKLAGARNIGGLDDFSRRVPFTLKQELVADQVAHPPFGSNLTYPVERYTRFSQTSGTAGRPMRWLDTPESWMWMLSNWRRVFEAADTGPGDRVFFAFSFGPFLGFWTAFEAATGLGILAIPGGGMHSAARLRVLIDTQATVLCCTPTYAIHLAEVAANEKIDLAAAGIRTVIVAGEPGGSIPATRRRIENLWGGARVVDHHGMTEIGPVSYACPARPDVLHIIEASYIAEIVDPRTGQRAAPGAAGELVLTNLGRTGSPLLRYRTGDIVEPAAEPVCPCGSREMALKGGILGRTDDMVVVRGVNVHPSAIENILRTCGGVAEYRVEISQPAALTELSIQIEPEPGDGASGLVRRIETALRDSLALRIPVTEVPAGSLPRFEMKARRWVRT